MNLHITYKTSKDKFKKQETYNNTGTTHVENAQKEEIQNTCTT
jgi:hypothetical protein